jgi:formate dehydrogenase subunit delta
MDLDNLVSMANRIGAFFAPMPDREAALAGVADHLRKFWEPRMRRQLLDAIDAGDAGALSDVVRDAVLAHRAKLQPAG